MEGDYQKPSDYQKGFSDGSAKTKAALVAEGWKSPAQATADCTNAYGEGITDERARIVGLFDAAVTKWWKRDNDTMPALADLYQRIIEGLREKK
jgi:hypothetical protein